MRFSSKSDGKSAVKVQISTSTQPTGIRFVKNEKLFKISEHDSDLCKNFANFPASRSFQVVAREKPPHKTGKQNFEEGPEKSPSFLIHRPQVRATGECRKVDSVNAEESCLPPAAVARKI